MALLTVTQLCSQADVEKRYGAAAVLNWCDHDADEVADTGAVDYCLNQGSEEIALYLRQRYDLAGLARSPLVMSWAVTLSAYFMSISRGNPPPDSLAVEFERIMARLALVAAGEIVLPGVPLRSDMRPGMSNLHVDRSYPRAIIRVEKETSTDQTTTLKEFRADSVPYPQ